MDHRPIVFALLIAGVTVQPCFAQDSITEQKDAVALETARQALDAARQKQLLDALAAAKQPTEGKAAITDAASTAEGLVLADYGMRSAAKAMAIKVKAWRTQHAAATEPLVVVQGSQAPSIAQWQSFNRMSTELETTLKLVAQDWKTVTAGSAGGGGGTKLGTFIAPIAVGAVIATISSLLKTDYGVAGTKLAPTADATRAIIIGALSDAQIPLKLPEFQVAGEPTAVKARLDELAPLQKAASALYHDDYLKRLAAAGGKPDKLDAAIASAGATSRPRWPTMMRW